VTEDTLLALDSESCDLFASGQQGRLAAAYRRRAQAIAYRRKTPALRAAGTK
jgi:hypothetical protein